MSSLYRSKSLAGALMLLAVLTCSTDASAQQSTAQTDLPVSGHRLVDSVTHPINDSLLSSIPGLPSPTRAAWVSAVATGVPVAIGLGMIIFNDPERIREYDSQGFLVRDYMADPDRTAAYLLIAAGVALGPSAGYVYGGAFDRGLKGIAVRVALGTAASALAYAAAGSGDDHESMDFSGIEAAVTLGVIGGTAIVGSSLFDIGRVRSVVRERNLERVQTQVGVRMGMVSGNTPGVILNFLF